MGSCFPEKGVVEIMWKPEISSYEIVHRALELRGARASMPSGPGTSDCLDLLVHAYKYPGELDKDVNRWPDMLGILRATLGWPEVGEPGPRPGDLATFWVKGPHVGIFINPAQIIHAGTSIIKLGSWYKWKRFSRGVLTWQ